MRNTRWQPHRAGLFNFWYYDDEVYHFADGKLLLRGSNGSGKSVTMQSLIPVLLDGRKSPDRLDPFGSRARKMEDYLLGEKDVVERDERTGYLYLEYKRLDAEQYITTGIGLRAKRHSNLDFWGFILTDNRRIGHDFFLYKTEYSPEDGEELKIPLTRRELEQRLGQGGRVVRGQKEYMDLVNKHVFGFETLEAFEELMKLLIQLRSPKLSKDYRPTVIYDILNESLPALSDEELRPLSDTIENMDQTKQHLDQLLRDREALRRLNSQYDRYNQYVLAEKANGYIKAEQKLRQINKQREEAGGELERSKQQLAHYHQTITEVRREETVLKNELVEWQEHDVFRAQKEKLKVEQSLKETIAQLGDKEQALDKKKRKEREVRSSIDQTEQRLAEKDKQIQDDLDEIHDLAAESGFPQHDLAENEFRQRYQTHYDFVLWHKEAQQYEEKLAETLKVLAEHTKKKEKLEEVERELGEKKKALDLKRDEEQKWQRLFEGEKDQFVQAFHQWHKLNVELKLQDDEIQEAARRALHWFEPYQLEDIKSPVAEAYHRHYGVLKEEQFTLEHRLKTKEQQIEEKNKELMEWKTKTDPEPKRHADTETARKQLEMKGIPFIPFYSAVEFHEHVPAPVRERIESAVTAMGLLDALIVPERHIQAVHDADRVLHPNPQLFAHTLTEYLRPTPSPAVDVSAEDIDNVLRSILISEQGEGQASIDDQGRYHIGLLHGHAPQEQQSVFIGKESRRQYRLQMIGQIEEELQILNEEKQALKKQIEQTLGRQQTLKEEYQRFPATESLNEAYRIVEEMRHMVNVLTKDIQTMNEHYKVHVEELQKIRNQLIELSSEFSFTLEEKIFDQAHRSMIEYQRYLQKLQLAYKDYVNYRDQLEQLRIRLAEMEDDVDELQGEVKKLSDDKITQSMHLEEIEKRLQELGAEEIRAKISQIEERLRQIPDEIETLIKQRTDAENRIRQLEVQLVDLSRELSFVQEMIHHWQHVFTRDYGLRLVKQQSSDGSSSEAEGLQGQGSDGQLDKDVIKQTLDLAKQVKQAYGSLLTQANLDRDSVTNKLIDVFYKEQGMLVEYRLTQEDVLELEQTPDPAGHELFQAQVEQLKTVAKRIQLYMEYNGSRVSPYYVMEQIEKDIALQQSILTQKDRELFEEIIMNNIGRIIRTRINRAEQWVKQMNQLMEERDTSSGLTFSIRWKPKTADVEEEMDTRELVELLRADARILKEEDIDRVTRHFRSKIERAKELMEEKGYGETLHQAIKEILDYRKWFAFTLYYKREGEQKKELTNHVFYTFSGGEKAMAMYIPLFSAAYSRYAEAGDDAPYIISLDEAFAGVDENNIRDMFDLVEKLGFDYIINSQALWGDYDTVSKLSICELVRPKNAPFVTVVRYLWDGKVKQLLSDQGGFTVGEAIRNERDREGENIEQFIP